MTAIREKSADAVYRLRRRRQMTQEEFGVFFGVTRRTVIRWEQWGMPWTVVNSERWVSLDLDNIVEGAVDDALTPA